MLEFTACERPKNDCFACQRVALPEASGLVVHRMEPRL